MKIQVSGRAQEDLSAGYEFYERQSPGIGQIRCSQILIPCSCFMASMWWSTVITA
jgi:hypothetical protein